VDNQFRADAGRLATSGRFIARQRMGRPAPIAAGMAAAGRIPKAADDRKSPRQPSRSLNPPASRSTIAIQVAPQARENTAPSVGTLYDRASWRGHFRGNKSCARYAGMEKATSGCPKIHHPRDAVIKITACAICGSDLHLLDGYQPTMESGDILGHENMGEVIEVGSEVTNLKIGDRVVVPFTISCGQCWFCQKGLYNSGRPFRSEKYAEVRKHLTERLGGLHLAVRRPKAPHRTAGRRSTTRSSSSE
jgi:hypothetical protein